MYTYIYIYTAALRKFDTFLVQWLLRVSAAIILHVVYRRGCAVVIPPPPLDT